MLQLVWALAFLVLLAGAAAALAALVDRPAGLLALPLLSGAAVVVYAFGLAGFLRVGVLLAVLLLAALCLWGAVHRQKQWRQAAREPALLLFLAAGAFIWVLFFVMQPMFTQWDEFTAWGLAPKMVVSNGAFYVAEPQNLKASFTYPGTSLVAVLFQPFGQWAEWACLAALDTLAFACLAAAAALPQDRRLGAVPVFAAGFVLPYFFADTAPGSYATQYANAMADLPLAMLFGGSLCLYYALGTKDRAFWLTALPLALLTLTKDICFAYGLIAVFLMGLDMWLAAEQPAKKALLPALAKGCGLAAVVLAAFVSWGRYTAAVTPTADTAAAVGSEGMSYGAVLANGLRQLLGIGREQDFAALMSAMGGAFFSRRVCLLGSGAMAVVCITLVAAAAWLCAEKGPARRRVLAAYVGLAFCFAALYAFHLILYYYNFSRSEAMILKDYDRYLTPYYQAWMLAMLALLARSAGGRLGAAALCAAAGAVLAVFLWRGIPAAGFWTPASTRYTVRMDVQQKAAALNTALTPQDTVLVLSQGDDATRWYYYRYELTGRVVNGFTGSYTDPADTSQQLKGDFMNVVAPDSQVLYPQDNTVCSPQGLMAYMEEIGCEYLLIDRSDGYLQQAFGPYFEGGLKDSMPASLYRFAGAGAEVPFVLAAQESEVPGNAG